MQLVDLMPALMEARDRIKEIDAKYEEEVGPLKEAKKELEAQIIEIFKERKEFSSRIQGATVSLSVKKTAKIFNEKELVEALKTQGLTEYVEERTSDVFKDSVLKEQAKLKEGEALLPGVVVQETEYLSVRSNDKKDARKISTNEFVKTPKE